MTLYKFRLLSEDDQALVTWDGDFMLTREEGKHTIALYKVDRFYVEVYYNQATGRIDRFNPVGAKKRLEFYFAVCHN